MKFLVWNHNFAASPDWKNKLAVSPILRAERFTVESQEAVYTHPATGSITNYLKIERTQKNNIKTAEPY